MTVERREAARLVPEAQPVCRAHDPAGTPSPVRLLEISPKGVALLLDPPPAVGAVIAVELTNTFTGFSCRRPLRVVRIAPHGGAFLVAGVFLDGLPPPDLADLLA